MALLSYLHWPDPRVTIVVVHTTNPFCRQLDVPSGLVVDVCCTNDSCDWLAWETKLLVGADIVRVSLQD